MFNNNSLYLQHHNFKQRGRLRRDTGHPVTSCAQKMRKSRPRDLKTGQLRITRMVMIVSFLYIIGNLPYSIYFPISFLGSSNALYGTLSFLILYSCNGSSFFIFYYFNKHYRNILNGYLKILTCRKNRNASCI